MTMIANELVDAVREVVKESLAHFNAGFESRLAASMQKALDIVIADYDSRLRQVEEDQAKIMRHLGMEA